MDLAAAIALVMVIEGLALAIFAGSVPELIAAMRAIDGQRLRMIGVGVAAAGAALYLLIRG